MQKSAFFVQKKLNKLLKMSVECNFWLIYLHFLMKQRTFAASTSNEDTDGKITLFYTN